MQWCCLFLTTFHGNVHRNFKGWLNSRVPPIRAIHKKSNQLVSLLNVEQGKNSKVYPCHLDSFFTFGAIVSKYDEDNHECYIELFAMSNSYEYWNNNIHAICRRLVINQRWKWLWRHRSKKPKGKKNWLFFNLGFLQRHTSNTSQGGAEKKLLYDFVLAKNVLSNRPVTNIC